MELKSSTQEKVKEQYSEETMRPLVSIIGSEGIRIQFEDVYFKYPDSDKYVLKNINYSFELGKT